MSPHPSVAPAGMPNRHPADWRLWLPLSAVVLVTSAWLLFFNLGHYPLWCDEADTALYARSIARTGDTFALFDHNLYATRNGTALKHLRGRYEVPGSFYFAAPFVGRSGTSSFWPRMPFAICGLLSVAFILFWMARTRLTTAAWIVLSIALLSNVSFFLFSRQCRYFALANLLSLVIVYLYLNRNGRISGIVWIMLASVGLLWTHYLPYAALYAVLACDYLLFARRQWRLTPGQLLLLLGPQLLVGMVTVWIYNPVGSEAVPNLPGQNLILDKLTLIWWNLRDLNKCEFCAGILLLAAPLAYFFTRNVWLLRASVAFVCYIVAVAILSPQPVGFTSVADVRYLSAFIPLCIALSALIIVSLTQHRWFLALPLAVLIFVPNVLNHPFSPDQWCSRPAEFVKELCNPRETSTSLAVRWIDEFVGKGESIWVSPEFREYPLLYHAPHPQYAWHLNSSRKEEKQFAALPPIHFMGMVPPDYFLVFGPVKVEVEKIIEILKGKGVDYKLVKLLDIYWDDMIRPEMFWRSFRPVERFNKNYEGVYIYRRVTPLPQNTSLQRP